MSTVRRSLLVMAVAPWTGARAAPPSPPTLRIAIGEYPPFSFAPPADAGPLPALIRVAAERAGFAVQFEFMPWARAEVEAAAGHFDATAFWGRTPERDEKFLASDALTTADWVWLARKGVAFDGTAQRLRQLDVGVMRGYTYGREFWAAVQRGEMQVQYLHSDLSGVRMLEAVRIDLMPINRLTACYFVGSSAAGFTVHRRPWMQADQGVHLMFSRRVDGWQERAASFNAGLRKVVAEGLDKRLLARIDCPLAAH